MSSSSQHVGGGRQWWLSQKGEPKGPYDEAFVLDGLRTGKIPPRTHAFPVGGQTWKRLGEWPEFASTCSAAISFSPPEPAADHPGETREMDALFDEALRHEQHGDWNQAIALYEQAAKKWPEQATFAMNCVAELRERQSCSPVFPMMNPLEERNQILRERSSENLISMVTGVTGLFLMVFAKESTSDFAGLASLAGIVLFGVGGAFYAKRKGHSPAWGLLSLLSLFC